MRHQAHLCSLIMDFGLLALGCVRGLSREGKSVLLATGPQRGVSHRLARDGTGVQTGDQVGAGGGTSDQRSDATLIQWF